jgi:hypothetical protein
MEADWKRSRNGKWMQGIWAKKITFSFTAGLKRIDIISYGKK